MLTAISTNTPLQTCVPISTTIKNVCSVAVILSCLTTNCAPVAHTQQINIENSALFSTDLTGASAYNNGNISYSWDGVSVMSVDRASNLIRIFEIEKLQDNWNDNGAASFSKEIIATAKSIVLCLSVQPRIFPTARDSIQFEYENELGDYLEFELFDNGQLKMFSYSHSGDAETANIAVNNMNEVVNEFYGRNI